MLIEEFEKLTGKTVTMEEYVEANVAYMSCSNSINKETFCAEWKKLKDSKVVSDLVAELRNVRKAYDDKLNKVSEYEAQIVKTKSDADKLAQLLVLQLWGDDDREDEIIKSLEAIKGERWVIEQKLSRNLYLTPDDKKYILEHLE